LGLRAVVLGLCAVVALSGCEVYRAAAPEEIAAARYVSDAPPSVSLVSMVNARSGRSAHAALLINGSEVVLYDPAGTFTHPDLPRAGDVHYGMSPRYVDYYERYHARFSHFVQVQTVYVDRATADRVIAQAQAEGRTPKMLCATSVAGALRGVPPFENVATSVFPESVRRDFAKIPGVRDSFVREDDLTQEKVWEREGEQPLAGG
jgi:hypothetical protein